MSGDASAQLLNAGASSGELALLRAFFSVLASIVGEPVADFVVNGDALKTAVVKMLVDDFDKEFAPFVQLHIDARAAKLATPK